MATILQEVLLKWVFEAGPRPSQNEGMVWCVCEGMGAGNPVFSTAALGRCQWDRHRVHFADGEFEVSESCFLPQRKRKGKLFTKRAQHPAFHGGILGAPSPLRGSFA